MGEKGMKRALTIIVAALVAASTQAHADKLTGAQIRATLPGAKIVGVNDLGSPYSVSVKRGGTLQGVQGTMNQFDDRGRWWIEADKLCVQWELWLFAQPTCYDVELDGNKLTRVHYESRTVIQSTLVR